MKNLKFGLPLCGLLGLIAVFLPWASVGPISTSLWKAREGDAYLILAGFAAALAMGALAVAKGPLQRWQSVVALVGFALVIVKIRDGLPTDFLKSPGDIGMKLVGLSAIVGAALSIATLARPEAAK